MKKIWKIKRDSEAVSPVIATILMVAITVVLAAVLLVLVLNIGDDSVPTSGTVTFASAGTGQGGNLTVTFISQPIANASVEAQVAGSALNYNLVGNGTNIVSGSVLNITSPVANGAAIQLVQTSNGNVIAQTTAVVP